MSVESPGDLYGLPLDRFVPERAALVRALRSEKRREEAVAVGALRRPSVAAWAVNQLVRTRPDDLGKLFEAGDALAAAQAQAAAAKGGGDATRCQHEVLRVVLQAAEGALDFAGQALSQTTMQRVDETLRVAAIDEQARRQVAEGSLTHELRLIGGVVSASDKHEQLTIEQKPPTAALGASHTGEILDHLGQMLQTPPEAIKTRDDQHIVGA